MALIILTDAMSNLKLSFNTATMQCIEFDGGSERQKLMEKALTTANAKSFEQLSKEDQANLRAAWNKIEWIQARVIDAGAEHFVKEHIEDIVKKSNSAIRETTPVPILRFQQIL